MTRMKRGEKTQSRPLFRSLLNHIFKILLLPINFCIAVGESTTKMFFFIVNIVRKLVSEIKLFLIKTARRIIGGGSLRPSYYMQLFLKRKLGGWIVSLRHFKFKKHVFVRFKSGGKAAVKVPVKRTKRVPARPFFAFIIKLQYFFLGSVITLIIIFVTQSYLFVKSLPSPTTIGHINYPLSTHIYDRNGKLLYEFYREENRTPVQLAKLPPYIAQASIAIEDKDFYHHNGVSLGSGIIRAMKELIINHSLQGGSTITQQLVKSALLTPERTVSRKIKEIILAIWTERIFNKNQIIEMYLNQVAYGGTSYGIEEAARNYFGKHANELSIAEAAFLAGLPQAPSVYSPYINPDAAKNRRNEVLQKMFEQGYIDKSQFQEAKDTPVTVAPAQTNILAPHFVFYVKSQLENTFGIREVEEGGLNVTTTLDYSLEQQAERILKEEVDKIKGLNVTNGAVMVTRPATGEILAMVGSTDYYSQPYGAFNVTTALRQPGSSIKPLMYSLALQRGYTEATIIDDSPVTFSYQGGPSYSPVNYDGKFHGKVPLRYALANSFNVPAVKVLNTLGVQNFVEQAKRMGISTWNDSSRFGLSLTLGGGEVTMVDMTKAYGVLADQGYIKDTTSVLKVTNSNGDVIYQYYPMRIKVLDSGISYILSDILSDNVARQLEFGTNSALVVPGYKVAVKTGTTNNVKDNWTFGYTPDILVGTWVGNNDGTPMNQALVSGITGAAPIWNRTMSYLLQNYVNNKNWYSKPDDVVAKNCYYGRPEYFLKGTENTVNCQASTPSPTPTPGK